MERCLLSTNLIIFWTGIDYLRKRNTLVEDRLEVLLSSFFAFSNSRDNFTKRNLWNFIFCLFFKLSKHEKGVELHSRWTRKRIKQWWTRQTWWCRATPSQGSLNILWGIHPKDVLIDQAYVILLKLVKK